jgi:iron complex transport system substrate-binding protein
MAAVSARLRRRGPTVGAVCTAGAAADTRRSRVMPALLAAGALYLACQPAGLNARGTPGTAASAIARQGRGPDPIRPPTLIPAPQTARTLMPRRIVSLIPAATEMLFAMGAENRIVGVSSYDRFPPAVDRLPRVGGLIDPNVERLLALKPDLVLVYDTQTDLKQQLARAGIPMFLYVHRGLPDITRTLRALGDRVDAKAAADAAATRIEQQLASVKARVSGRPRPRTLLVFARETGSLRGVNASGGIGFLHDLLELAGGTDVMADTNRESVPMSTELILARAPDVILELRYGDSLRRDNLDAERRVWNALPAVPAVRNGRVHLLGGDEFVVPGPRIVLAAERFARTLHQDAFK